MTINKITVQYGKRNVFENFSISVADESVTAILGPSGCGKTTLLFAIANAMQKEPGVSFVFQEPRLIPWCTLQKNLELTIRGSSSEKREQAIEYLDKVHLSSSARKFPTEISGGERQRVSIARAFSSRAPILLMDEPFQSQDTGLKEHLMETFLRLQEIEPRTVIAVTHDVYEAKTISNEIYVLGGKPAQLLYKKSSADVSTTELAAIISEQSQIFSRCL